MCESFSASFLFEKGGDNMNSKSCLSVAEVAETMGICRSKVYTLIRDSNLPHIKVGRRYIIPKIAFRDWLKNQSK